ncbi:DUF819 family protein [Psychrobacter piechaudii]|uniref:DUF819 domain-containing protein n=1 Tax=Psychrobacter piechaudii TaxID=1945521 RepID=A0A1R4GEK9_9GAMM|nr:DUF819 family protein [Psychrobacter piechaudii]SJM66362.1 hypothetical protein A1232T_00295 [Psychrobacter piechaudii]
MPDLSNLSFQNLAIDSLPLAFGIIMAIIGLVFYTQGLPGRFWRRFYAVLPGIVLCCFIPATLNSLGVFAEGIGTQIYGFTATYLLPASLLLMTLSMDVPKILGLGWKAVAMFFAASIAIIISGPISLGIAKWISPEMFTDDTLWRGFSAVAGSWIGGAANQAAMKELFGVSDDLFGMMILVDTTNASLWLLAILVMAKHSDKIDKFLRADTGSIERVVAAVESYERDNARPGSLNDLMVMFGLCFAMVGLAHFLGGEIANFFSPYTWAVQYSFASSFFWMVVIITLIGVGFSFTKVRRLDHIGASKMGTVFIFILIAAIGMQINLNGLVSQWRLLLIGLLWMCIHVMIVFIVARLIRAPFFFLAVGSNANTGGASSAPIVATAFHPSLAPVGVFLGILGYAVGTIGGYVSTQLMRLVVG